MCYIQAVNALAALADPTRRRIVELLAERPHDVAELNAHFPISQPAVSRHLRVLREHGLVRSRPEAARTGDGDQATLSVLAVAHAGKGSAVRSGMLAATGDLVVFADADMATPPEELPKLTNALETAEVALGSRIQPDGSDMRATQPRYRRFLGAVFHTLASIWVVGDVKDTQCGFKGFSHEAAQDLFSQQKVTSIVFDVEIIHLARRRGYSIAVVPIRWEDVRGSRMRPGAALALKVAWDLFRIPLLHRSVRKRR